MIVSACGGSAEEEILEQLIESGGNDISDINIDSGSGDFSMNIEGEDGEEINITSQNDDGSFSMTVEGEDGETMTFGGGTVPEGMETVIPDGGNVTGTFTSDNDRSVSLEYAMDRFEELVSTYDSVFDGEGISRSESSYATDDGTVRTVSWYSNEGNVNVSVSNCYSMSTGELSSVCVNIYEIDS